jgi:glutamate-5-semialdehyde dehydrogenase
MHDLETSARAAREASRVVATLETRVKNALIADVADAVFARREELLAANAADCEAARQAGLPAAKLQRLVLSAASVEQVVKGLRQVAALPDPVGEVTREYGVPSGLKVRKVRTPLGVIAMIYEARPAVTVEAFALCFKAGNACILKGGKEAARSNALLAGIVRERLRFAGLPEHAITSVSTLDREGLRELLSFDQFIDLVIPRGGTDLIRFVAQHSRIPTIQHYQGVCHLFVDAEADLEMALKLAITGKTSAPATCNATECVLVHRAIAERFVPKLVAGFVAAGVEVRGDDEVRRLGGPGVRAAAADDFGREFLDLIAAVRVVADLDAAVAHIERFGSNHTEAIVTRDEAAARAFARRVQASCVLVNASTRFNDGFQLGLGAEIGISTTRIHAYGPMGLEELTTQRFVVEGNGQTR